MQVSELYIYPVKSLGGIALQQSAVTGRGLQYDRRYMLVDKNGQFLTQRTFHELALFKLAMLDNAFKITYRDQAMLIPFSMQGTKIPVTVWDDVVNAIEAPDLYHQWFSDMLGQPVRLVYMGNDSERPVSSKYAYNNEQVSFADGYPVLLISEASLALLNSKLSQPIGMDRFRPNIVVQGMQPHEEDSLSAFQINKVQFKAAKPCARCVVITINQQTLERGKEPLATLATYRSVDNKINFGENIICVESGLIEVGDQLLFI